MKNEYILYQEKSMMFRKKEMNWPINCAVDFKF